MANEEKNSQTILNLQKELEEKEKELKRILEEKEKIQKEISFFEKENLKEELKKSLEEREKIKKEIEEIEGKEEEIKREKEKIESKEREEKDLFKKREIEKIRWEAEEKERALERKKWKLEEDLSKKEKEISELEEKIKKEDELKEKLTKIEESLSKLSEKVKKLKEEIEERKKLERDFEEAWEKYIKGDISSALEKLNQIQESLVKKIKEKKEKEEKEEIPKKTKEEFLKPLEQYQRGEIDVALESLRELLKEIKKRPREKKENELEKKEIAEPEKKEIAELKEKKIAEEKKEPLVLVIKEKPEELIEELKEKWEREREKFFEQEREKLRRLREELEERQRETLRAALEGKMIEREMEKLRSLQEELIKREIEVATQYQQMILAQRREWEKREKKLAEAETSLSFEELSEEEKQKRREIIKFLREKIREEREKIEKGAGIEEIERKAQQERQLLILEDALEQAIFLFNEKEIEKAKRVFLIIKDQLEQGQKLGVFEDLNKIPIYQKSIEFLKKSEEELKRIQKERERFIAYEKKKIEKIAETKRKFRPSLSGLLISLRQFFFPLPTVGIDISDNSIEMVWLSKKNEVLTFSRQIFKKGVVVEGEVMEAKPFSEAISLLLKNAKFPPFQPKKGPVLKAVVSLPESALYIGIFYFESTEDLFNKVREQVERTFPLPLEEIYWDYVVATEKDELNRTKVVCIIAKKDTVDSLVYFLRANGIEPIAFEAGILALKRVFSPKLPFLEPVGILDIGVSITNFNILDKEGFPEFSISIPYGAENLQREIAFSLRISFEEAERRIVEEGFEKTPNKEILEKEIEKILKEIKDGLFHYQEVSKKEVKRIFLIGGIATLSGFSQVIEKHLPNIKTEVLIPPFKLRTKETLFEKQLPLFIVAFGLAQRAISKDPSTAGINLLPEVLKAKEKRAFFFFKFKKLFKIRK